MCVQAGHMLVQAGHMRVQAGHMCVCVCMRGTCASILTDYAHVSAHPISPPTPTHAQMCTSLPPALLDCLKD